jgi:hypothetical protein
MEIDNAQHLKYLGVTLDRFLTYRAHCEKLKKKIASRNGLLRKLTGSCWGAQPHTLRTTAIALCQCFLNCVPRNPGVPRRSPQGSAKLK